MSKQISSLQNPFIKNIALLGEKARERREQGLFVAEGLREVGLALRNGYRASALLFDPVATPADAIEALLKTAVHPPEDLVEVSAAVFEKIAYRAGVANVVGVFHAQQVDLEQFEILENKTAPLILVLESIEKPGNLGAMLRTADAAGVSAVLVCDPNCDLYNPNAIRASLGAIFTLPVVAAKPEDAAHWLRERGIRILATWLDAAKSLYECDLTQPIAIVMGAEATGISETWVEQADERIIIPMQGQVDSLNVSASAAVLLFEAVRQRLNT